MAVIDPSDLSLDKFQRFFGIYFTSRHRFMLQVRRTAQLFDSCDEVVSRARFLQLATQMSWTLAYVDGQGTELFRDALIRSLLKINATLILHAKGDPVPATGENTIRLSHHTRGRHPGTWHYKMAYLPHLFHLDRLGYSGWSELAGVQPRDIAAVDRGAAERHFDAVIARDRDSGVSKFAQRAAAPLAVRDYVFLAGQVHNDSVIALCFEPDYLASFRTAVARLLEAGETVVVKLHPHCDRPRFMALLEPLACERLVITDGSIHDIIPGAKAVVTANSGVGYEALTYLKPVICLARSDYARAGWECREAATLPEVLRQAESTDLSLRIKRFLYLATRRYQVDVREEEAMDRHVLRLLCERYTQSQQGRKEAGAGAPEDDAPLLALDPG